MFLFKGKSETFLTLFTRMRIQEFTNSGKGLCLNIGREIRRYIKSIKGSRLCKVMITLEDTVEKVPAFNTTTNNETTNEIDSQGGTREIVREDMTIQVVTSTEGSVIVLKEIKPTVKGVIVIAEGAEDLEVKEKLYEAVKTVLGIPGNKVEVYASK